MSLHDDITRSIEYGSDAVYIHHHENRVRNRAQEMRRSSRLTSDHHTPATSLRF